MIRNLLAALAIAFTVSAVRVKDQSRGPRDSIEVMSLRLQGLGLFKVKKMPDMFVQVAIRDFEEKSWSGNFPSDVYASISEIHTQPLSIVQELIDENDHYLSPKMLSSAKREIA